MFQVVITSYVKRGEMEALHGICHLFYYPWLTQFTCFI